MPDNERVVGYIRVSTEEQADSGVSLKIQRSKIEMYAKLHDLILVDILEDEGISGKTLDRPGLTVALAMLDENQADGLLIVKLDRLTRRVADLATLLDNYFGEPHEGRAGKQLFSVQDSIDTRTAAGRLVLNVLMSVAQWERETIVERTQSAMDYKRSQGERLGSIPYGWVLDPGGKLLIEDPREQEGLAVIVEMSRRGATLRAIGTELDARGYRPKRGQRWAATSIREIIARLRTTTAA